jgi:hypothetical protein
LYLSGFLSSLPPRLFQTFAVFVLGHFLPAPFLVVCHMLTSFQIRLTRHVLNVLPTPLPPLLFPSSPALLAFRLALGDTTLFTLGDKVALFFGIAQNAIPGHLLSKTSKQAFWGFSLT